MKTYRDPFLEYLSSYNGRATFKLVLWRKNRNGAEERFEIRLQVQRSALPCAVKALKEFANDERTRIQELPL